MSAPSSRCIGNTCLRSRSVTSTQATNARVHILLYKQPMPSSTWNQCPRSHSQTQRIVVRALITLHKQQMPAFSFRHIPHPRRQQMPALILLHKQLMLAFSFRHIHTGNNCLYSHPLFVLVLAVRARLDCLGFQCAKLVCLGF